MEYDIQDLLERLKNHRVRGGFSGPLRETRAIWWDKLRTAQIQGVEYLKASYSGSLISYVRYVCEL